MATLIRWKRTGLLLLLILLVKSTTIHAQDPALCEFHYGTYSESTPIPVKSAGFASGVIDGKIYLASGFDVDQNGEVTRLNHLSVFDPETDTWDTTGARLPVSRSMWGQMNTVLDGKFYLIGGLSMDWVIDHFQITPYARVDVYDPQTDTWESKANLPDSLGANGVCTDGEKLYVTGGRNRDRQFSSFYAYDPATDSWEELTEMPIIRAVHVSVALDGKIYVISGNSGGGPENRTENCIVYDPGSDQWDDIAPLPNNVVIAAACVVDGEIYVFGGEGDNGNSGDAYKYIPEEDTWITIENMLPPRSQHGAVTIGRTIYLIGGRTSVTEVIDLVQKYELSEVCLDSFIPDDTINGDTILVDLSEYFSHVEGDEINFSVCLDDPGIIDATVDGSILTVTGLANGDAEVSILAESGEDQMGDVFRVNVTSPTGINDKFNIRSSMNIYPNPVRDLLNIYTGSMKIHRVDISSISGQILQSYNMDQTIFQLDLSSFQKGIYFITIRSKDFVTTRKIIKL